MKKVAGRKCQILQRSKVVTDQRAPDMAWHSLPPEALQVANQNLMRINSNDTIGLTVPYLQVMWSLHVSFALSYDVFLNNQITNASERLELFRLAGMCSVL